MAKEILLYSQIFSFTAERFIEEIEEAKDEDIDISMDSGGGDPQSAFGMVTKMQKHKGAKTLNVHGRAYSMAAFLICYADSTTALDVSDFLFHRAALPEFIENNPELFESEKPRLIDINNHLRKALESKVDVEKFERITNTTLDQLFSLDGRIDVRLNAKQAKQVKLIDKIISITPEIQASLDTNIPVMNNQIAAYIKGIENPMPIAAIKETETVKTPIESMDSQKFKAEHALVYAQAVKEGRLQGVKNENERVRAFMVFIDVDLKAVEEGIKGTEPLSTVQMAEFTKKMVSADYLKTLENGKPPPLNTDASTDKAKTEEEIAKDAKISEFEASVGKNLNPDKK